MNLATIEVDENTARRAFLDYRGAVRERHNAEDEMIMRGYREITRGSHCAPGPATSVAPAKLPHSLGGRVEASQRARSEGPRVAQARRRGSVCGRCGVGSDGARACCPRSPFLSC